MTFARGQVVVCLSCPHSENHTEVIWLSGLDKTMWFLQYHSCSVLPVVFTSDTMFTYLLIIISNNKITLRDCDIYCCDKVAGVILFTWECSSCCGSTVTLHSENWNVINCKVWLTVKCLEDGEWYLRGKGAGNEVVDFSRDKWMNE